MTMNIPQKTAVAPVNRMVGSFFNLRRSTPPWRVLVMAGALGSALNLTAASVSMTSSDGSGSSSFNAAGKWSNAQAPSAANDYFTAGFLLRTPTATAGSNTFVGGSLSLDYSAANALVGLAMKYGSGGGAVLVPNLKLNGGGIFNGVGGTMSVYGNITVLTNSFLDPQAGGRTRS